MIFLEDNEINFSQSHNEINFSLKNLFIYAVKKIFYDESIDNI